MILEVENINGLYIIPDFLTEEDHDLYFDYLQKDDANKCYQIHTATEYGWKFIPLKNNENEIINRTKDDYLGFSSEILNLKNLVCEKLNFFFAEKNITLNINHVLINKYGVGDGCMMHVDELEFWENYIICISFGSSTVAQFKNIDGDTQDIDIPKNSAYIMLEDARYKWQHGIIFAEQDNIHGKIRNRNLRISVSLREIKNCYLPQKN